jgi:hypothetical protein
MWLGYMHVHDHRASTGTRTVRRALMGLYSMMRLLRDVCWETALRTALRLTGSGVAVASAAMLLGTCSCINAQQQCTWQHAYLPTYLPTCLSAHKPAPITGMYKCGHVSHPPPIPTHSAPQRV